MACYLAFHYEDVARKTQGNRGRKAWGWGLGRWRRVIPGWDGRGALGSRGGGGSPRRPGAKPRPVFPSPKFLGFYPRNLPAAGLWAGTAKGDDNEEETGGQDEPGDRHLPSAWGRPLPGAIPFLSWPWCCGGWWCGYLPTGVRARCRGYGPPLGAGTKRAVASSPLRNSPPGASWPLAPAVVGGGARGSAGPLRSPGRPHCPYNATRGGAGSYRTRGPRRPSRGGGQGGVKGSRQVDGGWRGLGPRTGGPHHPPVGWRSCRGSGGPTQGPWAPPRAVSVWGRGGKGHPRP